VPDATNYVITERTTNFELVVTGLSYTFMGTDSGKYYDFSIKARTPYNFSNVVK
jgi:hypothetical protein